MPAVPALCIHVALSCAPTWSGAGLSRSWGAGKAAAEAAVETEHDELIRPSLSPSALLLVPLAPPPGPALLGLRAPMNAASQPPVPGRIHTLRRAAARNQEDA